MWFLLVQWFLLLLWITVFIKLGSGNIQSATPQAFRFQNVQKCARNEFYNLNYFVCSPCNEAEDGYTNELQSTVDKFACECPPYHQAIFHKTKRWPACKELCGNTTQPIESCQINNGPFLSTQCNFKYLNSTSADSIVLSRTHPESNGSNCQSCNGVYNFRYQDYCLANALLQPYLHYNSYWQVTTKAKVGNNNRIHFGDLKFVAFFCLALQNDTACQQLANLCVLSYYSMDKHSPCSAFLLTQMSDVAIKYAHAVEQLRALEPFLFYKKGRITRDLLTTTLHLANQTEMGIFSTTYELAGRLKRWGAFRLDQLNLCPWQKTPTLALGQQQSALSCELTLEQLIDVASRERNDNYQSLYINFTSNWEHLLHQLPVLIETLTPENQRSQPEEWQLVKRFQLISVQPRDNRMHSQSLPYEDAHKLLLFRSIRYVNRVELQYIIHDGQRIGLPLLRLRYHHIELTLNASLQDLYSFQLRVSFEHANHDASVRIILEMALPLLLLFAVVATLFRIQNLRRRRGTEMCQIVNLLELLLQLASYVAKALLGTALLIMILQQGKPQQIVPLIYGACLLQLVYVAVQLRRASQLEIFLIDWERPRSSCEGQRMNLDTSSLCSSVRTYVAESSVSAWRILFTANAWIRLSSSQRYSSLLQAVVTSAIYQLLGRFVQLPSLTCFFICAVYVVTYLFQLLLRRIMQLDPLQKFVDLCSQANISLFSLLEPGYGYYVHGRSPHGFADTDMSSMILQIQREAQNMSGRRGLLIDSDQQVYIILPPRNLRTYLDRLLLPFQRSRNGSMSQTLLYQKDLQISSVDCQVERTSIAYASINRFFCAFIDHAIKDMDYVIKEKTFFEKLFNCEIENYLTENKGTFYIDDAFSFSQVTLLGNHINIFVLELLVLLSVYLLSSSLILGAAVACALNMLLRHTFKLWMRRNVSRKTLIDERFLL